MGKRLYTLTSSRYRVEFHQDIQEDVFSKFTEYSQKDVIVVFKYKNIQQYNTMNSPESTMICYDVDDVFKAINNIFGDEKFFLTWG